ncbi:unnamed protein product [Gongylonema pulchrum]|uniref:Transposase n=1 Tax=Gongylonema pulchrum TaxID=637853 RepID=A0A183D578_9BILA|nr:unnamed protein product [Gongylonema pulchrum]
MSRKYPYSECAQVGNYSRKRQTSQRELFSDPSNNDRPWLKSLSSAEYRHAKLSNGSTFRVYTHPGKYIAVNASREMQQA